MTTISVDVEIDLEEEILGLSDYAFDRVCKAMLKERSGRRNRQGRADPGVAEDLPEMDPERVWSALRWLRLGDHRAALTELESAFSTPVDTAHQEKLYRSWLASRNASTQEAPTCA